MHTHPLKILLFDGTFRTTSFINRLAQGLSQRHKVIIAGFNEDLSQKIPGVCYIGLGDNTYLLKFIRAGSMLAFKVLFRYGDLLQLFRLMWLFLKRDRKAIQKHNLHNLLKLEKPDIIHLQWISNIPWFEDVIRQQQHKIILSQRGFHINVRPFVNHDYKAYLQEWFPQLNGFHSVSEAISQKSNAIWNATGKKNVVIYSGLNLDNFAFTETYSKPSGKLELLSVGRNHWKKGYKYALLSCKLLKDKGVSFNYTLLGITESEELLYLRQELGLAANVVFVPTVPVTEVYEKMSRSSILLVPSLEEGVPNVAIEAMALGLPVISTRCGGINELIEEGTNGWLTDVADPEGMARAVLDFAGKQQNIIAKMRIEARKKVEVQHTEERMITQMEAFYKKIHETA